VGGAETRCANLISCKIFSETKLKSKK